jgi:hypothetical protein
MFLKDVKIGDLVVPRNFGDKDDNYAFVSGMDGYCDKPQKITDIDTEDGVVEIDNEWWWPVRFVDDVPQRSSPGQRLARVQAAVGRLVATASGPDRLLQLQRRMVRATKAAADLVAGKVAKMGES